MPCGPCPKPDIWPENEWMWEIFSHMQSQAQVAGMGGFTGFSLSSLQFVLVACDVPQCLWNDALDAMRDLNQVAIKHWNKSDEE